MKIPLTPPKYEELNEMPAEELVKVLRYPSNPAPNGKYQHWDKLRHLEPPHGLTARQWWFAIKQARSHNYRKLPFHDLAGRPFMYCMPDPLLEGLHRIDSRASGRIAAPEQVANEDSRDRFLISSLIEEAITSSQLEGAATTRQEAVQMLRENRRPRDKSEQMILNNFVAMQNIVELRDSPMSIDLILDLHSVLTEDTLDDSTAAGRFQTPKEERVRVVDNSNGQTLHSPPPADVLDSRIQDLVDFANDNIQTDGFIHPIIRAIILHFWLAYDHPFVDGNGRVARALFYWAAARFDYWLLEFISISRILKLAPSRYARSFLYVETDENDVTYFLVDQVAVINRALDSLERYLQRKTNQIRRITDKLHKHSGLNHREIALLSHAVRHPGHRYTIRSHRTSHRVAYATARKDLLDLVAMGLLENQPLDRKTFGFVAPHDIEDRLSRLAKESA